MIPARKHITLAAAAVAGAALTSTAFGQQMANLDSDRASYLAAACGNISDLNKRTGCRAEASIRFDQERSAAAKQITAGANQITAEANKSIATAQELQRCIAFLVQKRDSGVVFDRKITRDNVCSLARELGMRDGPG